MPEPAPRLLLVEDEALIRQTFARYLGRRGWEVVPAASAEEALEIAEREKFSVILLDNVLTGATGLSALQRLSALAQAPVLIMTGHADEEFVRDAKLLGARDVLRKPLEPAEVDLALRDALGP